MRELPVVSTVDVLHVQGIVRRFALELGFSSYQSQELAIVVTEMATNIVKYAGSGVIRVETQSDERGFYLQLSASDKGPKFRNLLAAQNDGWDQDGPIDPLAMLRRKGIGGGLGAIMRLTDFFEVQELPDGKSIVVKKYRKQR